MLCAALHPKTENVVPEMTLGQKQRLFMSLLPRLIDYIYAQGYECTMGDGYRDPRSHGKQGSEGPYGRPQSAHKGRLAVDLNLFRGGVYLDDTEAHRPLGEYWKSLNSFCVWGGDFDYDGDGKGDDGNHYSMVHQEIK